jgi:hypothetical protein
MIIEGTSIKNQMYIETLSFSAAFQNIFSRHNHKLLGNMTCILSAISDSFTFFYNFQIVVQL